jgi:hypothetical protein
MHAPVTTTQLGRTLIITAALVAITACGGGGAAAPQASTPIAVGPSLTSPADPSAAPPSTPADSPAPPSSAPPRVPVPVVLGTKASWTEPTLVMRGSCNQFTAVIDGSSRYHVAAECDQRIHYATSSNGRTWKSITFKTPTRRFDVEPQVALDGSRLYVAFTRLRPVDGGCGDDGLVDVGVFYRSRTLRSGAWSATVQIGRAGDHLQSLRVVKGVVHATVITGEGQGPVYYLSQRGATQRRVLIRDARETSLRIGDDGRPRVAFTTVHAVKVATIGRGVRVSTATVFAANDVFMRAPALVLGAHDTAYVSWAATTWSGGGCVDGDFRSPNEGTWFATDATGRWELKRLTPDASYASLAADVSTGRVHVLYPDRRGYRFVTRSEDGTWSGSRLDRGLEISGLTLRRDPITGRFLAIGTLWTDDGSTTGSKDGIYALIRR